MIKVVITIINYIYNYVYIIQRGHHVNCKIIFV